MRISDSGILKRKDIGFYTTHIDNGNFGKTCIVDAVVFARQADNVTEERCRVCIFCAETPEMMSDEMGRIFKFDCASDASNGIPAMWAYANEMVEMEIYLTKFVFGDFCKNFTGIEVSIDKISFVDGSEIRY